jgi:hypothetical protein
MPMTPEEFANLYLPTRVEDEEWYALEIRVSKYRNAKYGLDTALKDQLVGYLKHRSGKPGSGIVAGDKGGYSIPENGIESFPLARLMHAFCGKCLPQEAAQVVSIFSHWKNHDKAAKSCKYQTLQGFADGCLGTDCNGLTYAFLKSEYPKVGYTTDTAIGTYRSQGTKRKSLAELASCDCLIFPSDAHIAMISEVTSLTDEKAECRITQSRSPSLGGAQTGTGTITFRKGIFYYNGTMLTTIVKVKGMPA